MSKHRSEGAPGERQSLRVGQPFNPFKLFNGIFIPEALVLTKLISPGAKLAYGRLTRYSGQNGRCYPSVPRLASEIGVSVRQAQRYLAELDRQGFIRRIERCDGSGQNSNVYVFLWHPLFEDGVTQTAREGVTDSSPEGVTYRSPKESQTEESHFEEGQNIDLDYPPTNRKNRDSQVDGSADPSRCKFYPRLREALADYMTTSDDTERLYPPDRLVVDVMDAAAGATEEEVVRCLLYLRNERGLVPGSRHGPRHFAWFKSVIGDYFKQRTCQRCRRGQFRQRGRGHSEHAEHFATRPTW